MVDNRSALAQLEAGLRDETSSVTALLQTCILLGGQVGAEALRVRARQELKGYTTAETIPDYREVHGIICIDAVTLAGHVTGQQISPAALPDFAAGFMTEHPILTNPLAELEDFARTSDFTIKLSPAGAQELVRLWNHTAGNGRIISLYWQVSRSAVAAIITGVRAALVEMVGELLAVAPDGQLPGRRGVDAAAHLPAAGDRNTVTVLNGHSVGDNSGVTLTADAGLPVRETFWQRWRKRGLIVSPATVVPGAHVTGQARGASPAAPERQIPTADAVHRTIVAVDIEEFSSPWRTNADRLTIRSGLYEAVHRALLISGVVWEECDHSDLGDGVLVLAPSAYPKAVFSEQVVPALAEALVCYNKERLPAERIRLRVVLHAGEVSYDAHGATGQAIVHAFRLLDSPAIKQELTQSPGCLALITSAWFYDEVVRHSAHSRPSRYVRVVIHVKETITHAWIYARYGDEGPSGDLRRPG
ncbi:hypothetical protein [Amycolatopsis sp. NPDC051716]|uniref:AbiTii domain-containing protein n=1 Tax=Amycolatopsis sp. NPDC051716 TaxID=3155804 RepID=UPI0034133446